MPQAPQLPAYSPCAAHVRFPPAGVYVPELVLGHLLTGSNFNDDEQRLTGGTYGYGAKLTNILSTEFHVETLDARANKLYRQVWVRRRHCARQRGVVCIPDVYAHLVCALSELDGQHGQCRNARYHPGAWRWRVRLHARDLLP